MTSNTLAGRFDLPCIHDICSLTQYYHCKGQCELHPTVHHTHKRSNGKEIRPECPTSLIRAADLTWAGTSQRCGDGLPVWTLFKTVCYAMQIQSTLYPQTEKPSRWPTGRSYCTAVHWDHSLAVLDTILYLMAHTGLKTSWNRICSWNAWVSGNSVRHRMLHRDKKHLRSIIPVIWLNLCLTT